MNEVGVPAIQINPCSLIFTCSRFLNNAKIVVFLVKSTRRSAEICAQGSRGSAETNVSSGD